MIILVNKYLKKNLPEFSSEYNDLIRQQLSGGPE